MDRNQAMNNFFEIMLRRIYQGEKVIYESLGAMAQAASDGELKRAFTHHRSETASQIDRLKEVFEQLSINPEKTKIGEAEGVLGKGKEMLKSLATFSFTGPSKSMEGLLNEGKEMLEHFEGTDISDYVLAGGAQMIEQAEASTYKALIALAQKLGHEEVVNLLEKSLKEEEAAFELLNKVADAQLESMEVAQV